MDSFNHQKLNYSNIYTWGNGELKGLFLWVPQTLLQTTCHFKKQWKDLSLTWLPQTPAQPFKNHWTFCFMLKTKLICPSQKFHLSSSISDVLFLFKISYYRPSRNGQSFILFSEQIYGNQEHTVKPNTNFGLGAMD